MKVDPLTLKYLLESMNEGVCEMHALMRAQFSRDTLPALARIAHKLRGEATVVGLANLSQLIIGLEDTLERLQGLVKANKTHLQPVGIHLLKIIKVCEHVRKSAEKSAEQSRIARGGKALPGKRAQNTRLKAPDRGAGVVAALQILAINVGRSCGKRVALNLDKFNIAEVPQALQMKVQDIVIQLVRNAIAHGIELPSQRKSLGKSPGGTVAVVARKSGNELVVAVRDNGQGINLEEIRRRLVIKFDYNVMNAAKMSKEALLNSLFLPGFSTLAEQQQHAGRGVGLDLVKEHAKSLGGRVDVSYKEKSYAQFVVRIPLSTAYNVTELRPQRKVRANRFSAVPLLTDVAQASQLKR